MQRLSKMQGRLQNQFTRILLIVAIFATSICTVSPQDVRLSYAQTVPTASPTTAPPTTAPSTGPVQTPANRTLMQYFEWYLSEEGGHWNRLASEARNLAQVGINGVWIPPAYKGAFNPVDVGYGPYDLYDLGEFEQKGSVRTKYGTKAQLKRAIDSLHANQIQVYADIVMNHKAGGDGEETITVTETNPNNRHQATTLPTSITALTKFDYPVRNGKYSTFRWNSTHFDAIDWDTTRKLNRIFKIQGKTWDYEVENTFGNYDYLMFADVDYDNPEVVAEMKTWGSWFVNEMKLDGFRIDAVKHIKYDFTRDWLDSVRQSAGKSLFAVGEYWSSSTPAIINYHNKVNSNMSLFDADLHYRMHHVSTRGGAYDLRSLLNGTFSALRPQHAVTFVDNHDTQPGQSLQSWVEEWFKPQAYALILTRQEGIPTVFYGDYYGIPNNRLPALKSKLDPLLVARKDYAYGAQHNYFDHADVVGWTRTGDSTRPDSGLAAVISDGISGTKTMFVGTEHAGEIWTDISKNRTDRITINAAGWGTFPVNARSVSVYVKERPPVTDRLAPSAPTNLYVIQKTENSAAIAWFPGHDDEAVTNYEVYRDGLKIGTTAAPYFHDSGLQPTTIYRYTVRALDDASNKSAAGPVLTLQTSDLQPGNQVTIYYKKGFLTPHIHYRPFNGQWTTAPGVKMEAGEHPDYFKATLQIGQVSRVEVCFNNGGSTWDNNNGRNYSFEPGVWTYTPNGTTINASGQMVSQPIVSGAPFVPVPDTIAPSIPHGLTVEAVSEQAVRLRWQPSTDNSGIGGYEVYRNEQRIATVSDKETSYLDGGLAAQSNYSYRLVALDTSGNRSAMSEAKSTQTLNTPEQSNTVTIYYKTTWPSAFMHYRPLGGIWSSAPGVAMEATDLGFVKVTVNIGSATHVETVFNNGNSIWDNNNGADYDFTPGVWTVIPSETGSSAMITSGPPNAAIVTAADWHDLQPPNSPSALTVSNKTETSVRLAWTAATDNRGIRGYEIWRDGSKIGATSNTEFENTGLRAGQTYRYRVIAVDLFGNISSSASSSATEAETFVTTNSPPTPPTPPTPVQNSATIYYKLGYSTPYIHYRPVGGVWSTAPGLRMNPAEVNGYMKITVALGTSTRVEVCFNNGNGIWDSNNSLNYMFDTGVSTYIPATIAGTIVSGVPQPSAPDVTAPSRPIGLQSIEKTNQSIRLQWSPSTDNVTVKHYEIFRDGNKIATVTGTTFADLGLTSTTAYTYTVRAADQAGNVSALSTPLIVTTAAANSVTIYYKKGNSTPFIHYRVQGGAWTIAPGVAMKDSEVRGYSVITIQTGSATQLEACFNNGRGIWDSNGGKNYRFELGTSTYTPNTDSRRPGTIERKKP